MKSILYVSFLNEDIRPGYRIKIHSQCKAFARLGFHSFLFIENREGFVLYSFKKEEEKLNTYLGYKRKLAGDRNVLDEFFLFSSFCKIMIDIVERYGINYIYMRRIVPITPKLIRLLKILKRKKIPVIYEYPTLPWEEEMKGKKSIVRKMFYLLDKIQYKSLIKNVSRVTYIGKYEGSDRKFIQIQNGGFAENYVCVKEERKSNDFVMIGVSQINRVNGYELVIEALYEYYKREPERKIYFYLVGDVIDDILHDELEGKIHRYKLDKYVKFYGLKMGKELDEIYEKASIAINSLKLEEHSGFDISKGVATLKTVEYTFRGLPQVAVAPLIIDGKNTAAPPFLYVVEDKYHMDLSDIVRFTDSLKMSPKEIREYAICHMSWDIILKRALDSLEDISLSYEL